MENFEIGYSHNNKKPVYHGEVDQSLTVTNATQDLVNFKSEFNIGLALPFEFCKSKKSEKFEKHSMTKWFDEAGNLNRLEVVFRGNSGTAGKLDQDVLNILMSMCVEQNTDSPVFTYEDIRKRLGLAKGSHGNIRDSIQRMLGMRIEFRQSFYSATNSKNTNVEKHLIQSRKSVINEDYSDLKNIDARHSVTFDRDIMQNLLGGYYSVLSRETYLSLDSGAVRRLYQLIVSHRDVGKRNHFTLEIEDIASVLGLTAKKEFFGHVKKYFNSLKEALPDLEFTFATVNRKKVVKISFTGDQNLIGNDDEFFLALAKWYGPDVLEKNGIDVDYINDIREKFQKLIIYEKTRVKLCELYLDMILHQKHVNHSQVQSVKALLTSALTQKTEYMKPDGFKKFVVDRVKHKEILETKAMALREDEKKKFELQLQEKQTKLLAQSTFENLKMKNPKTYERYEKEAMKLWGDEIRESLLTEQILEEKIKELIQSRMEAGGADHSMMDSFQTEDLAQLLTNERAVLSSVIIDPESLSEIDDLKISASDFSDTKYQIVFSHVEKLRTLGKPVDLVSLVDSLNQNNDIYKVGGASYLAGIYNDLASSANIRHYAERVKEQSLSRIVFNKAKEIAGFSKDNLSREELIEKVNQSLIALNDNQDSGTSLEMKESVISVIQSLRDKDSLKHTLTKTGFSAIDDKIEGLTPGQLIILAARPAMGKTSLALNIGFNVAQKYDEHVLVYSLEMMHKELTERMISMEAQVNGKKFKSRDFDHGDLLKIDKAARKCSELKLILDDYSGSTISRIRNQSLRHKAKYGKLRMVIIDYLQLIPYKESKKGNKADDIGELTRSLKLLSKELNCPIICLSQLNRGVEARENKRPNLADLRDSGAIEQDADMVWFIYRDEVYNPDTKAPSEAEVIISKNRGGETGTAKLAWKGEFTKFTERAEDLF